MPDLGRLLADAVDDVLGLVGRAGAEVLGGGADAARDVLLVLPTRPATSCVVVPMRSPTVCAVRPTATAAPWPAWPTKSATSRAVSTVRATTTGPFSSSTVCAWRTPRCTGSLDQTEREVRAIPS